MTLSANFTSKSVVDLQSCRALTFALARLSCLLFVSTIFVVNKDFHNDASPQQSLHIHYIFRANLSTLVPSSDADRRGLDTRNGDSVETGA